jgi:protein-L-isoaspartate(D-aspartate) O-methyltransferase
VDAGYEAAAAAARAEMVGRVRALGASERVLAALARVPRHRLVPRFWAMTTLGVAEHAFEFAEGDVDALPRLHDIDQAVAVNKVTGAAGGTTSTASAPRLLAAQADLLALEPGMSVLEIGTGPGYFAAVLAELLGASGRVVSLDIDTAVVDDSARRLAALGYVNVTVIARDGHDGAPDLAPFDRIVGSVGCNDVATAWLRKLAPHGFALIPLLHGAAHPMVRVDTRGKGSVVSRSGYVRIRGSQDGVALWPRARDVVIPTEREPLPATLAAALAVEPGREAPGGLGEWHLGYWVAAADQRAGRLAMLNDGNGSTARIDASGGAMTWAGGNGRALADDLLMHAESWLRAGAPDAGAHGQRFEPIDAPTPAGDESGWVIERVDHRQVITPGGARG